MCFFGGRQETPEVSAAPAPAATPPPAIAPSPTISPSISAPQTAEQRRKKIAAMRYGMLSTIKTSPQGLAGVGPELNVPAAAGATKEKLGQ